MSAESLLGKLESTLVLADTQKFNHTLLIGGKANDFTHDVAHDLTAHSGLALGVRGAFKEWSTLRDDVAFVDTYSDAGHCGEF